MNNSNIFGDLLTTLKDWWIAIADEVEAHPHRAMLLIAFLIFTHIYRWF